MLKSKNLFSFSNDELALALTSLAIEKTISSISHNDLKLFEKRLLEKHNSYFSDCLENPQFLTSVLQEMYGNVEDVLNGIILELEKFSHFKSISKFLLFLKHNCGNNEQRLAC